MEGRSTISKLFVCLILVSVNMVVYGQSILGDDYKKELWKSINPSNNKPLTLPGSRQEKKVSPVNAPLDNKYLKSYINYKFKGLDHFLEITEPKYKLNPNLTKYSGAIPLNQLPAGSTQLVYMGGHFVMVNTGGFLVFPSGRSLSGWEPKKLSEKSKNILINVFGKEIEE